MRAMTRRVASQLGQSMGSTSGHGLADIEGSDRGSLWPEADHVAQALLKVFESPQVVLGRPCHPEGSGCRARAGTVT